MNLRKTLVAGAVTSGVALAGAATVYACTPLPSADLSQGYASGGGALLLTGQNWAPGQVLAVHWDGVAGPVLATISANADSTLGPAPLRVPLTAQPGYHLVTVSTTGIDTPTVQRLPVQVLGASAAIGRAPGALLPASSGVQPSGAGTAAVAGLAVLVVAGAGLFGAGAVSLARSHRRVLVGGGRRR